MEITKRREIFFLSELRAIACIAIVILHTFYAASVYAPDHTARIAALTTRNLMMWAVPCFVMVSGALLLDPAREVTYRKIFRKYIPRVLAALVLFSVVFQIFDDATGESGIQFKTILYGLQNAVTGSGWKHMWYLYLITALSAAVLSENCCFPQLKRYVLLVKRLFGVSIAAANVANTDRKIDSILYLCL